MSREVSMQFGKPGTLNRSSGGGSSSGGLTLLWTNPSPTASFAAQSVSIDLNDFSYYGVILKFQNTQDVYSPIYIYPVNELLNFAMIIYGGNSNRTGDRRFAYSISNRAISFNAANYNGSANNAYCVPYQIFGIR